MVQRITTYAAGGSGVPQPLEQQNLNVIPQLGNALFVSAAKAAYSLAKRELTRTLRQVHGNADKELKRQAADWFVVGALLRSLATEATRAAPASLKPLARNLLRADDPWGAFGVLGAWRLRECATTRVMPQDFPPSQKAVSRKLSRKRSRVTRRSIVALVNSYEGARRPPLGAFTEHQRHDPLAKFRGEVAQALHRHQGAQPRKFPALVRASIIGTTWPNHSSFFLKIPFQARLGLTLTILLRLRADHTVWTHQLDFVIEPLFKAIIREVRRRELAQQLASLSSLDIAALAATATSQCVYETTMNVSMMLTVGTTSHTLEPALKSAVDAAATAHVVLTVTDVLSLMAVADGKEFDAVSKALTKKWHLAIYSDLGNQPSPPRSIELVKDATVGAPTPFDGDQMMNLLLTSLPQPIGSTILDVLSRPASIMAAAQAEVASCFGVPPSWSVALPIENWDADPLPLLAPAGSSLTTIGVLKTHWGTRKPLAPAVGGGNARAGLTESSLCLVVDGIVAPNENLAVREAQAQLDALLCGLWFLDDRRYSARLSQTAFVRRALDGAVMRVMLARTDQFLSRRVDLTEVQRLIEVASTLATRWDDPYQQDMWRRVSEGIGFLRSAFSAALFYERYLFLWMALEALLSKLAIDDEESYTKVAPIGTRVAHRAAVLLVPDPAMAGLTYGEARWVTALEFGALYHLRNKAVHEGRRNPPIDEIILEQFQQRVVSVFEAITHNAFRYGMRRIEELLAWCEHIHKETDLVPA